MSDRWQILPFLLVGFGSFVGGNARYVVGRLVGTRLQFPLGTFLINVVGSFVLGVIGGLLARRATPHADWIRLALGVGFCGGFTTFSTFAFETHALLEDGVWPTAVAYLAASFLGGLLAVRLGIVAARAWL